MTLEEERASLEQGKCPKCGGPEIVAKCPAGPEYSIWTIRYDCLRCRWCWLFQLDALTPLERQLRCLARLLTLLKVEHVPPETSGGRMLEGDGFYLYDAAPVGREPDWVYHVERPAFDPAAAALGLGVRC